MKNKETPDSAQYSVLVLSPPDGTRTPARTVASEYEYRVAEHEYEHEYEC